MKVFKSVKARNILIITVVSIFISILFQSESLLYRITNIIIHVINTLLLYCVLCAYSKYIRNYSSTVYEPCALVASLFYTVQPLHITSSSINDNISLALLLVGVLMWVVGSHGCRLVSDAFIVVAVVAIMIGTWCSSLPILVLGPVIAAMVGVLESKLSGCGVSPTQIYLAGTLVLLIIVSTIALLTIRGIPESNAAVRLEQTIRSISSVLNVCSARGFVGVMFHTWDISAKQLLPYSGNWRNMNAIMSFKIQTNVVDHVVKDTADGLYWVITMKWIPATVEFVLVTLHVIRKTPQIAFSALKVDQSGFFLQPLTGAERIDYLGTISLIVLLCLSLLCVLSANLKYLVDGSIDSSHKRSTGGIIWSYSKSAFHWGISKINVMLAQHTWLGKASALVLIWLLLCLPVAIHNMCLLIESQFNSVTAMKRLSTEFGAGLNIPTAALAFLIGLALVDAWSSSLVSRDSDSCHSLPHDSTGCAPDISVLVRDTSVVNTSHTDIPPTIIAFLVAALGISDMETKPGNQNSGTFMRLPSSLPPAVFTLTVNAVWTLVVLLGLRSYAISF